MSKISNRSASCLAKLLRCLQDIWPAISHDLAVEATRFEGSPKATNAKMVVEEGIFSREAQDVFTLDGRERQSMWPLAQSGDVDVAPGPVGRRLLPSRLYQREKYSIQVDLRVRDVIELDDLCVSAWFARLRAGRCVRRAEAADHAYFPESSTVASTTAHRGKEVQQVSAVRCNSPAEGPRVHENSIASAPTVIMADDGYPKCTLCVTVVMFMCPGCIWEWPGWTILVRGRSNWP